jgi:pyruvate kinase
MVSRTDRLRHHRHDRFRKVFYQLSLSWGCFRPYRNKDSTDEIYSQAIEKALDTGLVKNGDSSSSPEAYRRVSGTTTP